MSDAILPVRVVFVLLPDSLVLDWAGPAEALRIANQLRVAAGQPERFRVEFAGPSPSAPRASTAGWIKIYPGFRLLKMHAPIILL